MISGREKLRWEEEKLIWTEVVTQHPMGELADTDAIKFLASCALIMNKLKRSYFKPVREFLFTLTLLWIFILR